MKRDFTCEELCQKLDLSREKLLSYSEILGINKDEIEDSYLFNELQIRAIISINGYCKLGYDTQAIKKFLHLSSSPLLCVQSSIIKDIIGLVPAFIITKNSKDQVVLKNNSLSSSLDDCLDNKLNISFIDIAKRLSLSQSDIEQITAKYRECEESGNRQEFYAHGTLDDRYFHFRIIIIKSVDSINSELITTIFSDYTEDFLAQKNLSDNSVGFHNTIDKIPFPILILEDDQIIYFNQHVHKKFKKEAISDYSFSSFLYSFSNSPELVGNILKKKKDLIESNSSNLHIEKIEFNIADKYYIFNINFSQIDNKHMLVGFSDITEKEEHYGNLMSERNLFENGPVMIMKCLNRDENKTIEWISENVYHFTGYTKSEIIEDNIDINSLVSEDMLPKLLEEADMFYAKKQEFYSHSPYKMIKKDGEEIWVKDHTRLLFDANKNYIGYLEYLIDVSDMKAFEQDLKKAKEDAEDANKAKSTFLSHMSHEIRTPLNAINGFSQLIYDVEKDLDKREKLRTIVQSGNHLLDIINNILELSKIESGNIKLSKTEFSLKNMIDEVKRIISISANNKSLDFKVIKSLIIPDLVVGDEIQLKQILINLLSNAVNYTEEGEIILEVKYLNDNVIFYVKDTGIGIKKHKLETIFNAFEQIRTDEKKITYGTGLGLSIVKRIVDEMKGQIKVSSQLNKGSVFQVTIPLPQGKGLLKKNSKADFEMNTVTDLSHVRILVAEDNAINQKLIKSILKKVNNICDIADNGKIALDKLHENDYDIILLDMQMPVMDGMETLSNIRSDDKLKDLPVIALTAFAMSEERDKYIAAGCNEFVAKPVNKNELYFKIAQLCK